MGQPVDPHTGAALPPGQAEPALPDVTDPEPPANLAGLPSATPSPTPAPASALGVIGVTNDPPPASFASRLVSRIRRQRTLGQFFRDVMRDKDLRGAVTREHVIAFLSWRLSEGGAARFNPLNTTYRLQGSTDYNSVGVQNYRSWDDGVLATVRTLMQAGYGFPRIVSEIRHSKTSAHDVDLAVNESGWVSGRVANHQRGTYALWGIPLVRAHFRHYARTPVSGA